MLLVCLHSGRLMLTSSLDVRSFEFKGEIVETQLLAFCTIFFSLLCLPNPFALFEVELAEHGSGLDFLGVRSLQEFIIK